MTTLEDIIDNAEPLVDRLQSAGMEVEPYKSPPMGKNVFGIGISRAAGGAPERIRVWVGNGPKYDTSISKRDKQAVLTVTEDARKVVTTHTVTATTEKKARDRGLEIAPMVPNSRRTTKAVLAHPGSAKDYREKKATKSTTSYLYNTKWTVTVTAHAQAMEQSFLLGMDESAHFVAALPEKAKTVKEAHAMLRPDGVTDDAERQGEWFFQPVTDEKIKAKIIRAVKRNPTAILTSMSNGGWRQRTVTGRPMERGSSHRAGMLIKTVHIRGNERRT